MPASVLRMLHVVALATALIATLVVSPIARAQDEAPAPRPAVIEVNALSSRADVVTGAEMLVEVRLPAGLEAADIAAIVQSPNGDAFVATDMLTDMGDGRLIGLIDGLPQGRSDIVVSATDTRGARLGVTTHPLTGPVFSGPQVTPWFCDTEDAGLGEPDDPATCHVDEPVASFHYMSNSQDSFQSYDPDSPPNPSDVASTTTDRGDEVPYIVRVERGTLNRGIYDFAVLYDPEAEFTPTAPQAGWNNKLLYLFGGGCAPDHNQDAGGEDVLNDMALSRGFAVASSSLNVLGNNCNAVVSAEMVSMVKERLAESYGPIRYTIGQGCSGGSIQQHAIAANYPGLLDGIRPQCSYPDVFSIQPELFECEMLLPYFRAKSPTLWPTPDDQTAVVGHQSTSSCDAWVNGFGFPASVGDPTTGCNHLTLPAQRVDPTFSEPDHAWTEDNPTGTRCTLFDYHKAMFGIDPDTGYAPRPWDNVGVQYGLNALLDGSITAEQFVDLNVKIGGLDINYQPTDARMIADPEALQTVYATGLISHGEHLADVPIMDIRGSSNAEIHTDVHTPTMRARLIKHNGHADNWVTWNSPGPLVPHPPIVEDSFLLMDEWLAAIEADTSDADLADKVVAHRPEEAVDACYLSGQKVTDPAQCQAALPSYETPRLVAGGPASGDVMKCALTPFNRKAYGEVEFTDEQAVALATVFTSGVCDWTKPGVGEQAPDGPWQSYASGTAGVVMGDAPTSVPFGPAEACGLAVTGQRVVRVDEADPVELGLTLASLCGNIPQRVVLARVDDFADALAASGLAGALQAPVLLTGGDQLDQRIADRLAVWGTDEVIVAGGEEAIAPEVATALTDAGHAVVRIGGETRVDTAALLADELIRRTGATVDEVVLATGQAFPDALVAGVLAGVTQHPVLLTNRAELHPAALEALGRVLVEGGQVVIAGGPLALDPDVEAAVVDAGYRVRRAEGLTRYETAIELNRRARAAGAGLDTLMLVSGTEYTGALVAGPAALLAGGSMLLVPPSGLDPVASVREYLDVHEPRIGTIVIVGADAQLSDQVEAQLEDLGFS